MELNHRLQHVGLVSCRLTTGSWSDRGRSRTDKITSLSSWPLFQFAYSAVKWQVQESHLAGVGYEPSLGTGPPASKSFFSCRPRNRTVATGLMRASWAPAAPASVFE